MPATRTVFAVFAIVAVIAAGGCGGEAGRAVVERGGQPARIISLAPSATEVLFALGLGDRVVGVTRYCTYPPAAREIAQVGGFLDPNYEAILRLQPDWAVTLDIHGDAAEKLEALGIRTVAVNHRTLDGILHSVGSIGEVCGVSAAALLDEMRGTMERVQRATADRVRPRVLISAGRGYDSGKLEEVYAAGRGQWYEEIIEMAGGVNAFTDEGVMFPALSGEGLVRLNPEVIIEMASDLDTMGLTASDVVAQWAPLQAIDAVRNGRVYVLTGDYVKIPGPRFVRILEDVARVLHPDAFGEGS